MDDYRLLNIFFSLSVILTIIFEIIPICRTGEISSDINFINVKMLLKLLLKMLLKVVTMLF